MSPAGGWPDGFWETPYDGAAVPGCAEPVSWLDGANCQRFAYGVLSLFGLECPPLRSSELWDDTETTRVAATPAPLDLVLFGKEAYGAHVGVWVGTDEVLHLCAEVGRPVVWPLAEFAARERYATIVGSKTVLR